MNSVSIFDDYSWTKQFSGRSVVYLMQWGGKDYIGGTDWFYRRMKDWRRFARLNSISEMAVTPLLVCHKEAKEFYEQRLIAAYDTFHTGHNKTSTGGSAGRRGIHPNTKAALIAFNTGRVLPEVTRRKISLSNGNPTEETRQRKSHAAKIRWAKQKGEL